MNRTVILAIVAVVVIAGAGAYVYFLAPELLGGRFGTAKPDATAGNALGTRAPGTKTRPASKTTAGAPAPANAQTKVPEATKTATTMKAAPTNVTPAGTPAPPVRKVAAFDRITAADPATTWSRARTIIGDVDCDNAADTVAVGLNKQEVHVALARAADPAPQILVFDIGGSGGVSSPKVAFESLDFDPAERGLGAIEGLRRSRTCKGLLLGDRDQDPVHIVWSQKTQHIEWYRVPRQPAAKPR